MQCHQGNRIRSTNVRTNNSKPASYHADLTEGLPCGCDRRVRGRSRERRGSSDEGSGEPTCFRSRGSKRSRFPVLL